MCRVHQVVQHGKRLVAVQYAALLRRGPPPSVGHLPPDVLQRVRRPARHHNAARLHHVDILRLGADKLCAVQVQPRSVHDGEEEMNHVCWVTVYPL